MDDNGVYVLDEIYKRCRGLSAEDITFLKAVERQMPLATDVSRADILLYGRLGADRAIALVHTRPHSISPVYPHLLTGQVVSSDQEPLILHTLIEGRPKQGGRRLIADGAPVIKQVYPLRRPGERQVIAALSVETNLLEHERHRRRSQVFQRSLLQLQMMAQRAQLVGAEELSPFGEHDGVVVADQKRVIRYTSGIATNLYRRIGYAGGLLNRNLGDLETEDDDLARAALYAGRCLEREEEAGGRHWVKKAIPLLNLPYPPILRWISRRGESEEPSHVILLVHDSTETRRRERELRVKTAMIQEVHHRVKNNLQTIASLLRMQAHRMQDEEARLAMEEAVGRILSVAVIHEFLSYHDSRVINIKEVSSHILNQMRQGVLGPDKRIYFELNGPPIYLSARQATACALIINELLQNAVEHGFKKRNVGRVSLTLQDEGDTVVVRVLDDGSGFPDDFSIETADSLGLQIVQTLAQEDLKGTIEMRNGDGAEAIVIFPKIPLSDE
jgi:two-component sensor histidine kinase